ncbi:MAG TPA: transcriptional regulator [Verrucomicrobiales bacterium]|nr:transcriptional regulator [Verrucomicrobiales bacterium]
MIDFSKLDKVIHERGRLSIMTLLAGRAEWTFPELREELGLSDGNLITHLRTLEAQGYVVSSRNTPGTRRATHYHLTPQGRKAFEEYLAVLEAIVRRGKG